jgi:plasmid maintenance system antidote protein VapI
MEIQETERTMEIKSAGDVRAEIARLNVRLYHVAALIGVHKNYLSQVLCERAPLSGEMLLRLNAGLSLAQQEAAAKRRAEAARDGGPSATRL